MVLLIGIYCARVVYGALYFAQGANKPRTISSAVELVTLLLVLFMMRYELRKGEASSGSVFCFWLAEVAFGSAILAFFIEHANEMDEHFWFWSFCTTWGLCIIQLLLHLWADNSFKKSSGNPVNPEVFASFLNRLTFSWVTKLLAKGYLNPIQGSNLWQLRTIDKCKRLVHIFYNEWRKSPKIELVHFGVLTDTEDESDDSGGSADTGDCQVPSYTRKRFPEDCKTWRHRCNVIIALAKGFGGFFALTGIFEIFNIILTFLRPALLDALITFVESPEEPQWLGFTYASVLFFLIIIRGFVNQRYMYGVHITGIRMRSALTSAVYRKAMRLSSHARNKYSLGEITNLMSVDAMYIETMTFFLHSFWSAPVQLIIAMSYLWVYLGPSALAGLVALLFLMGANGAVANYVKKLQVKNMKIKDRRIKVTNEVLNGIKIIKYYAWEVAFLRMILGIRESELDTQKKSSLALTTTTVNFSCAPILYAVVAFTSFILSSGGDVLTPQIAFVSLALVSTLTRPLAFLPNAIANAVQAFVSMKRLTKFLMEEEINEADIDRDPYSAGTHVDSQSCKGNKAYRSSPDKTLVHRLNVSVRKGQLVAVVGQVGSGKSSLLSAMLGELHKNQGSVKVSGSVAYVAQEAWIQNEKLQKNILFGKEMKSLRYKSVIDACALVKDLEVLPGGDQTEIGEKGINLSGGQKQRVSLARAVYQDRDMYFLDDPLSAVDAHVGKHIFENVVGPNGLLKSKTRILVTHGISYLPKVDKIVVMKEGRISEVGTYQELLRKEGAFADFIKTYLAESSDSDHDQSSEGSLTSSLKLRRRWVNLLINYPQTLTQIEYHRKSHRSVVSEQKSVVEERNKTGQKLMDVEEVQTGNIKLTCLASYMKALGGPAMLFVLLGTIGILLGDFGSNIWLSEWSDDSFKENPTSTTLRLGVYAALGFEQAFAVATQNIALALGCVIASRAMHTKLLDGIIHAPMSFFDTTPLGRIINRFSQDMNILDSNMRLTIMTFLKGVASLLATLIAISYTTPIFLAFVVPLLIAYYMVQRFYIKSSNQLRRLQSVRTSPIYSHFAESVQGSPTVRAYSQQQRFIDLSDDLLDSMQMARYSSMMTNRWLSIWLEFLGGSVALFSSFYAVLSRGDITGGLAGLSITYSLNVTDRMAFLVQNLSDLETNIVSVERINEYSKVNSEARWIIRERRPPRSWPEFGNIEFKRYSVRYRPGLDLILKNISMKLQPQEKLGVVGRTGAGKSSLMSGLFRLIEPAQGSICIDDVDINDIGLHDLRSKITIIPQDPVLFSGTLRLNLDPFDEHLDREVWESLEHAHLKSFVASLPEQLRHVCAEGGANLSVGQRQLLCLARALLRKTKVLVLDEATAAVDMETDDLIQQTIRSEFKESTVLTIAHRLNTVMDYDRILVLDQGEIKELDTPSRLLADKNSAFYKMAKEASLVA
ncbi:hypothetical protein CAPTEDRAFT_161237 [Capitella teleta]|uniref:ABC-type glutathione-S-conjugate transporter n=1 Tax=Capitella teleta TaxID=283909 RepID=R7V3R3_CAPTE|nr:hypothetical protein CAPTEDRAFT_161237 [Capitella teleta]|eukprot:ELU10450.1 hypothetical protein CAPTEDRAFT_161237 [Capitella teleta]